MKIKTSTFAKRQTIESPFSYYSGTWEELEALTEYWSAHDQRAGYKPGVILVTVPAEGFYSGVVKLTVETPLKARFSARRITEEPFAEILANGQKSEAVAVEIVLYSRALLVEEGEHPDVGTDYEIVSINARTSVQPEPMTPMAMARNFLALAGGTKAEYTAEQFAESIHYWSTRAMHGGSS